jgi:hypothetical protein
MKLPIDVVRWSEICFVSPAMFWVRVHQLLNQIGVNQILMDQKDLTASRLGAVFINMRVVVRRFSSSPPVSVETI